MEPESLTSRKRTEAKIAEKFLEDREGTSTGTAVALTDSYRPLKNTVATIEIAKAYKEPIRYQSGNSKAQVLLRIPMSSNESAFQKNMQRTKFIENMLQSLGPDVEESTKWMLSELARKNDKLYEEVAREKGYITSQTKKMDAPSAAAMWEDARVNTRQMRVITRHLDAYFGARLIVPESKVKQAMSKPIKRRKLKSDEAGLDTNPSGNLTAEQMRLPREKL
jgi:hypothetical protein